MPCLTKSLPCGFRRELFILSHCRKPHLPADPETFTMKRWRVTLPRTLITSTCTFGTLQEVTIGNSYGSYGNSFPLSILPRSPPLHPSWQSPHLKDLVLFCGVHALEQAQNSRNLLPKNTIHVRLCQLEAGVAKVCVCVWVNCVCVCVDLGSMVRVGISPNLNAAPSVLDEFASGKSPTSIQNGQGICVVLILNHVQFWFCHNFAFLQ